MKRPAAHSDSILVTRPAPERRRPSGAGASPELRTRGGGRGGQQSPSGAEAAGHTSRAAKEMRGRRAGLGRHARGAGRACRQPCRRAARAGARLVPTPPSARRWGAAVDTSTQSVGMGSQ